MEYTRALTATLLAGLVAIQSFAQSETGPASRLLDCGLGMGLQVERGPWLSNADWQRMLPGSSLLRDDLPARSDGFFNAYGYRPGLRDVGQSIGMGMVSGHASLRLGKANLDGRYQEKLRLGIVYAGSEYVEEVWSRASTAAYDTLVSVQTGQLYVLDTTYRDTYSASLTRSRIGIEGTYIAHRITTSRFSWFVGIGLQAGMTTGGEATVSRYVTRNEERYHEGYRSTFETLGEERFRTAASGYGGLHGLFGLDLRLGKKSPFWSALHLYSEMRPSILAVSMPSLPSRVIGSWQMLSGLRVDLR
ncbi:MAG TPA: hypothetical protein PKY96_04115 [Flavobacteriales bacterium]|nr:hypothetical protein [Flavobacteriales bacterium]